MAMATLSDDEIGAALQGLSGWELVGGQITKQYRLGGFAGAITFVVRLSYEAQAADHHPDLDIRYDKVAVTLSTHSEGGGTAQDLDPAPAPGPPPPPPRPPPTARVASRPGPSTGPGRSTPSRPVADYPLPRRRRWSFGRSAASRCSTV